MPITVDNIHDQVTRLATSFNSNPGSFTPKEHSGISSLITTSTETTLFELIDALNTKADSRIGVTRKESVEKIGILGSETTERVLIRDARGQTKDQPFQKLEETPEAYMISVVGTTRGALKLIDLSDETPDKDAFKASLLVRMKTKLEELNIGEKISDPEAQSKKVRDFENYLVTELSKKGIKFNENPLTDKKDIAKALTDSRDICNLSDPQPHIATVWNGKDGDVITTLAARVAPFSETQKDEFRQISTFNKIYYKEPKTTLFEKLRGLDTKVTPVGSELPQWYKDLSPLQQKLVHDNAGKLADGDATVATSLRFIPGLRNAYLEVDAKTSSAAEHSTSVMNTVLRTGTVAYYQSKQPKTQEDVTEANVTHLTDLAKKSGLTPALQIYNYNMFDEAKIVSLIRDAGVKKDVEISQVGMQDSFNKEEMIVRINQGQHIFNLERRESNKVDSLQIISCKSGKDRTDFGARIRKLYKYVGGDDTSAPDKRSVAGRCAMAAHGETIAGGYGGNYGSLGLKHSGFFKYLSKIDRGNSFGQFEWLATDHIKNLSKNKLSKLNVVKPEEDHHKAQSPAASLESPTSSRSESPVDPLLSPPRSAFRDLFPRSSSSESLDSKALLPDGTPTSPAKLTRQEGSRKVGRI